MNLFLALPILVPLLTAVVCFLFWRRVVVQRSLGLLGSAGLLASALKLLHSVWRDGIQSAQTGNWPAPFGITLVADIFSAIMVILAGLMGFGVMVYSLASMDRPRESFGYYPFFHILLAGVCGAFLTGDLFNLYVWFEVMLMASFVLIVLGGDRAQLEGSIKYVTLNLIASALLLAAVGILYGLAGTLNMADLALHMDEGIKPGLSTAIAMLFLLAFGIKAAVFPLFFWLPASYHTPPVAVSSIFAGLLTKVGVYALIRVFTLLFLQNVDYTHRLILTLAALTMITGVLGAIAQNEMRRILSFHIISQIGYMIMGLGLLTRTALAGSIFYIAHHIIVKTNLFLVSGIVMRLTGTNQLKEAGGLYVRSPMLAILFMIPAMSLAGLPPLSGFWAKLALVQAGLEIESYTIVAVALAVSLFTLFSMTKIWAEVFWKGTAGKGSGAAFEPLSFKARVFYYGPVAALSLLTVIMGFVAEPFFVLVRTAAEQLMNPAEYIQAVMKGAS